MKNYKILTNSDLLKLEDIVNMHLNDGYICVGGLVVVANKSTFACDYLYYQAVAKIDFRKVD